MFKKNLNKFFDFLGYRITRRHGYLPKEFRQIPDASNYSPLFIPSKGNADFDIFFNTGSAYTLVSKDRCYVLYILAKQALALGGDFWECGVYKGGTAMMLSQLLNTCQNTKQLHLFDTFEGMPETNSQNDLHRKGDFSDTHYEDVVKRVNQSLNIRFHKGYIPDTFKGLEQSQIAFAHIDVDIHKSIIDCCEFIYPKMTSGGFMIFDDYGFPSCPGARKAVDTFFSDKKEYPLILSTGQAIVFKL
jgi:O-methyltransferase